MRRDRDKPSRNAFLYLVRPVLNDWLCRLSTHLLQPLDDIFQRLNFTAIYMGDCSLQITVQLLRLNAPQQIPIPKQTQRFCDNFDVDPYSPDSTLNFK